MSRKKKRACASPVCFRGAGARFYPSRLAAHLGKPSAHGLTGGKKKEREIPIADSRMFLDESRGCPDNSCRNQRMGEYCPFLLNSAVEIFSQKV
jgi:hypothetical protein